MTYVRPTYDEVKARIAADLAAIPEVLREPFANAFAQADHGQYGYLEWIDRQCSPLTCELERLNDWAALYSVSRLLATASVGNVVATGNFGTQILANTLLRGQNGLDYYVLAAIPLGAGNTNVTVRCTSTGIATNMVMGQALTLIDPIPGCNSVMNVGVNGLTGGADDELLDDWRARVVDEWSVVVTRGARSGKKDDYRAWAKNAHPSVTNALVRTHVLGVGTVLVQPICNSLLNRLPSPAVLSAIAVAFESLVPATSDWRIASPVVRPISIEIHLLPGNDTQANRDAITAALRSLVLAEQSEVSLLAAAEIDAAIATVTSQYTRILPLADTAVDPGEVFVLDAITFS